ncbi:MAG TPA: hypothetical protein VNR67_05090 [Solirubrobacterales bacterium]|nr:hypothetical protein [Solirubrobacterales bacterium]
MRLILATNHLGLGGSESYLLTVAEQLERLGHEATVYGADPGPGTAVAEERGIPLASLDQLPSEPDAALVQDAAVSYDLLARFPSLPQVFVAHSESFDVQAPPQFGEAVRAVVALNDRVAARIRISAGEPEVVRLRQPIDTERFTPRSPLPPRARKALLLSNAPNDDRVAMVEAACSAAGIELVRIGGREGQTRDPREAMHEVEIVIGYGRSVLEAMACGRAAYVYDWNGGEGWMTAESYPRIESDGIAGRSGETIVDGDRLAADLRAYSPAMGPVNHDLVIGHHRANVHAQQLVELLRRFGAAPSSNAEAPLEEMARLVRLEWRARTEVHKLQHENVALDQALQHLKARERRAQEIAKQEATKVERLAAAYEATLSWRLTAPLRALGGLLGRRRRGRSTP